MTGKRLLREMQWSRRHEAELQRANESSRSFRLRTILPALAVAQLLPLGLLANFLIHLSWNQQQDRVRQGIRETAVAQASAVEILVESQIRILQSLASSPFIDADLARFYDRCRDVMMLNADMATITLIATDGQQVLNLRTPYTTALLGAGDRPHQRAAFATAQPAVSDLFVGRVSGEHVVDVTVPVVRAGEVPYILSASLDVSRLSDRLVRRTDSARDVAMIVDGNHRVVARSRGADAFVGRQLPKEAYREILQEPNGSGLLRLDDEPQTMTACAPVDRTNWIVTYGKPAQTEATALRQWLLFLGGLWLAAMLIAGISAVAVVRRLGYATRRLRSMARAVGDSRTFSVEHFTISEFDEIGKALLQSDLQLKHELALREAAEAERARLLKRESQARSEAEAANRSKDEFLAALGHELRNPLAAIANSARILQSDAATGEHRATALRTVRRQVRNLSRMFEDLLDLRRAAIGKMELKREPLDVGTCARRAIESLAAAGVLERERVRVDVRAEAWVSADPVRIEQIIANLATNAAKFNPSDGCIMLTVDRDDRYATIACADTGAGIDADSLQHVFELFYQAESEQATAGHGIGLALVKQLVEMHGGTITAASPGIGCGATFTVRLPLLSCA